MEGILPGLRGMLNWHPIFVHFPIALWTAALLFEALAVLRKSDDAHRTAVRLLYLGTLVGFAAMGTGLLAEEAVPETGPAHEVMEIHETFMYISTSVAVGLCLVALFLRDKLTEGRRKLFLVGLLLTSHVRCVFGQPE